MEGRRAEAGEADGEEDGAGGRSAGKDAAAGQSDVRAAYDGAPERAGVNEADECSAGASEGCGADVVGRLTGAAGAGARGAGGVEGVDEPGRGDAIVG